MKRFTITAALICACVCVFAQVTDTLNLMPKPKAIKIQDGRFAITNKFTIAIHGPSSSKLTAAVNRFFRQLGKRTNLYFQQEFIPIAIGTAADNQSEASLSVTYGKSIEPAIGMDESYELNISETKIAINAATDIGAQRGLETLYQLIAPGKTSFYCPLVTVNDNPRFKWRGLMIDVARHFIPFEVLKRNIDAMTIVKMNVLHLHLSDDEGFRVESFVYPLLQQKGSNGQYYTQNQLKELVAYAHDRGIIIVPEFDLPGHCSSILAAYPSLASYPSNYTPSVRYKIDTIKNFNIGKVMKMINESPTPTIDPTKESTYTFFDGLLKEMSGIFTDSYFHVGADENNGVAWKQNPKIVAFMNAKGMKNTDELQAYFVKRMYAIAKKYNKRLIGWEEAFNPSIAEDVIIQKWKPAANDSLSAKIIRHNNQVIVSNGFYLDYFLPAYIHYANDPVTPGIASIADKGILGGEAALWAELIDGDNEELRAWPRAAAIAERLWSAAEVKDVDDMYRRLWATDFELNDRAINEYGNYIKALARWVNDEDLNTVTTLAGVYTPVKGYKRLMGAMFNLGAVRRNLASPLVNIADVVHTDSEDRWYFRKLMDSYLTRHDSTDHNQIKLQLLRWQNNKARFDHVAANSPYLQTISDLSDNLSAAASIGLQALNGEGNKDEQLKKLQQFAKASHEVELAIIPEIEALVTEKIIPEPTSYSMF